MIHILAELAPLKVTDGSRPVLRASSAQDRALNGVTGQKWWPAISKRPALAIPLFDGDFTQDVEAATASFTVRLDGLANLDSDARGYRWAGAPVSIYAIDTSTALNAAGSYDVASLDTVRAFKGRVEGFNLVGNALTITAEIDKEPFEKDVLVLTYAGTGDAEGGQDLKGRLKPWIFGRALNVEPILVNSIDSVVQFSAYPVQGISALYERGASFGPSIGNYPTYAALVAANIPAGKWATCHALGMARLGAPPYGVITGDVDGDNTSGFLRRTGAIIQRVATARGVAAALIDTASLNALDAAVPYDINLVLTEQISVLDLARRLARPCNAQAGLDFQGRLFAVRPTIATPALTLDAQGRQLPPVRQCQEAEVSAPYKRIMFGANRSWRVHTFDEIAFDAELIDRGDYDPAKTYRRGNIVSLPNGSRWLYVSDTPKAGSMPSETNADWELMTGAITAGNITYEDGTPVEALKPAEPGATDGMNDEERDEFDQLATDTAAAQANIAAAQAQIAAIQSSVATDFSAINAEVDALQSDLVSAQQSIGTVSTNLSTLTAEVGSVSGSLSSLSAQVGTINADVGTLASRITSAEGQISSTASTVATQGAAISANATAISNAVGNLATLTTQVGAGSNPNLLKNGSFENGLTGWTATGAGWAASNAGWGRTANTYTNPAAGAYVYLQSDAFAINNGATYTVTADNLMFKSADCWSRIEISWLGSDGTTNVGNSYGPTKTAQRDFSATGVNRAELKLTAAAPGNAYFARVSLVTYKASGTLTVTGWRQVKFEIGALATPYSDEASVSSSWTALNTATTNLASLTTRVATAESSITTNATALTTLTGRTATLETTVSTQGASITSLTSTTTTQGGSIATLQTQMSTANANISTNATAISTANGNISSLTTRVGAAESAITSNATALSTLTGRTATLETTVSSQGAWITSLQSATSTLTGNVATLTTQVSAGNNPNLVRSGSFEDGFAHWARTGAGWTNNSDGGWGSVAINYTDPAVGAYVYLLSDLIKINVGATYTITADNLMTLASGGAGYSRIEIIWYAADGTTETGHSYGPSKTASADFSNSGVNRALLKLTETAPADSIFARISLVTYKSAGVLNNVGWRQVKFEQGALATPFTAEATFVQTITAVTTLDTQYASLSSTVGTQGAAITTNATAITNVDGRTATLETIVSAQGGQISNLQSVTTTQDGTIAKHTSDIATANANISSTASALSTLTTSYAALETRVASAEGSVTSLTSSLSSANGSISTLQASVSSLNGSVSTLQQSSTTQSGQISTLQNTVSTQGGSITANATAITTLQGSVSALSTTVSSQGASISSLQSTTSTLAGNVSTLTTQVSAGSNPNLLKNGSFEHGLTWWTATGAGWSAGAGGWGTVATTYTNPADGSYVYLLSDAFAVNNGATYTVTADNLMFKSADCWSRIEISWLAADGTTSVGNAYGPTKTVQRDFNSTGVNRAELKLTATAPSNAYRARVSLVTYKANGTMSVTGWRQVKFEAGSLATAYSADALIAQSFQTLSTLTTQYASLSSTVATQGASISTQATAISTLQGNVTDLFAKWSLELDVNGYVSGMVTNNNGTRADMTLRMDKVKMVTPSGLGGYWQVTFDSQGRPTQTIGDDASGVTIEIGYLT
ncbi:hypothetical protein VH570_19540 [Sphingobium sp. HT1-2]|uniref:beta strand repeat-containing protein n=1 Tax=Sphingobium sp. HT1-2 TaxID=3111640 RepID=UPI003C12AFB8